MDLTPAQTMLICTTRLKDTPTNVLVQIHWSWVMSSGFSPLNETQANLKFTGDVYTKVSEY